MSEVGANSNLMNVVGSGNNILYEQRPFFFSRTGASLALEGIYRGNAAFLIAGGPSFGQVEKSKLSGVWTMTLNNAVSSFRGNAACIVDDPSRFNYSMWLDPRIQKFTPLSTLEKPLWDNRMLETSIGLEQRWQLSDSVVGDCPNVVGFRRNEQFNAERFLYEETINWGCSAKLGGGRSVILPALRILFLLGFRKVYLLGVDFEMADDKKYHFDEDRSRPAIRSNMETYQKLGQWFAQLQPYFLKEGFVVQNCNPLSQLDVFPYISFEDAVYSATANLGDTIKERTFGMYRKLEEKIAETERLTSIKDEATTSALDSSEKADVPSANVLEDSKVRYLVLRNHQSPGDIVMLTAAVRDIHQNHPGKFVTDVRTSCPALWENNPYITSLDENDPWVETIECDYPLIHQSNTGPWHFIHGFTQFLSNHLKVDIRPTAFKGDIHLSMPEKTWISQVQQITDEQVPFWVIVAGGKRDFTIKWWSQNRYQEIVNHFRGKIFFVQVGEVDHEHRALKGVLDLRGQTDLRQLVRLIHHAQGVLCPVTLAMHLAAAVETRRDFPRKNRACVVVAGGREPSHWEAYPNHQFLHTTGALKCCDNGGCWKSRTVPLGDGDEKDSPSNLCVDVVFDNQSLETQSKFKKTDAPSNALAFPESTWSKLLPRCMDLVSAKDAIEAIELYFKGKAINYASDEEWKIAERAMSETK